MPAACHLRGDAAYSIPAAKHLRAARCTVVRACATARTSPPRPRICPGPGLLLTCCRGLEDVAAEEALAALNLGHPEHKWDAVRVTYFGAVLLVPDSPGALLTSLLPSLATLRTVDSVAVWIGAVTASLSAVARSDGSTPANDPPQGAGHSKDDLATLSGAVCDPQLEPAWRQALRTWLSLHPQAPSSPTRPLRFRATVDKYKIRYPGLDTRDVAAALGSGGLTALRHTATQPTSTDPTHMTPATQLSLATATAAPDLATPAQHGAAGTQSPLGGTPSGTSALSQQGPTEGTHSPPLATPSATCSAQQTQEALSGPVTTLSNTQCCDFVVDLEQWDIELQGLVIPDTHREVPGLSQNTLQAARLHWENWLSARTHSHTHADMRGDTSSEMPLSEQQAKGMSAQGRHQWVLLGLTLPWTTVHGGQMHGDGGLVVDKGVGGYMDPRTRLRVVQGATALRPTTAHCIARLAHIQAGEVVCDPCCGVGTLPIEAATLTPLAQYIAGDVEEEVVSGAQTNVASAHTLLPHLPHIQVQQWDASALPVADASVDVVISDLPWGVREMRPRLGRKNPSLKRFYPLLFKELARILRPSGGRALLITGAKQLLHSALQHTESQLEVDWSRDLVIGGRAVVLVKLTRL